MSGKKHVVDFRIGLDAVLYMNLISLIRFGSCEVRHLKRVLVCSNVLHVLAQTKQRWRSRVKHLQGPERKGPVLNEERLLKTTPMFTSIPKCRKIYVMVLVQRDTRSDSIFNGTSKNAQPS